MVSNAVLTGCQHGELIVFCPYKNELVHIRELALVTILTGYFTQRTTNSPGFMREDITRTFIIFGSLFRRRTN